MSSAILYLAIVAIWACVLIPRWLKRDSAHAAAAPQPAPRAVHFDEDVPEEEEDHADQGGRPLRMAAPLSPEESRRRMLAARRRLMVMLIGLEVAAITLAALKLAAIWVIVPPSIMLAGYLMLLREAGRADAEYARDEAEAAAAARARQRARERARAAQEHRIDAPGAGEAAAALAAKFAAAPVAEDYEDTGRDFAPGLAGKYTTSNAHAQSPQGDLDADYDDDAYDADDYDRAVGD